MEVGVNEDQPPGVNDDQPHDDRPTMKTWQAPILRTIPLRETKHGSGRYGDGAGRTSSGSG